MVTGTGFQPGATIVLAWRDGGDSSTVLADASGAVQVQLLILPESRSGPIVLIVVDDARVTASFLVRWAPLRPGSAVWQGHFGR